jgi:hypothetical protein
VDVEDVPEGLEPLGAEALNAGEGEQSGVELGEQALIDLTGARVVDLLEIVGDRVADAVERGELEGGVFEQVIELLGEGLDDAGGVGEGADLEGVIAVDLFEQGDLVEDASVVAVVHDGCSCEGGLG